MTATTLNHNCQCVWQKWEVKKYQVLCNMKKTIQCWYHLKTLMMMKSRINARALCSLRRPQPICKRIWKSKRKFLITSIWMEISLNLRKYQTNKMKQDFSTKHTIITCRFSFWTKKATATWLIKFQAWMEISLNRDR